MAKGKGKGKKGAGKGAKSKKDAVASVAAPDEYDSMDIEQLKLAIVDMNSNLKDFKNQRNSYQIERDQVQQFFDITHDEVIQTECAIENLEHEMESMQNTHQNDIRWYMSKVAHLELDHQNALKLINKETNTTLKEENDRFETKCQQLKELKVDLQQRLNEELLAHEQAIRSLVGLQQKEMRKLDQEFAKQTNLLSSRYQKKLISLKEDLELQRKMEIHEIEERKNLHINDLMANHEKSFNEMRDYYNSITKDNLGLIKSLKEELAELKSKATLNERTMEEIAAENRKLSEPLNLTQNELKDLQSKLSNYMKEKRSLKLARKRAVLLDMQLKQETSQMEILTASFAAIESERDQLYATFEGVIREVQIKSNEKNDVIGKQIDKMIERCGASKDIGMVRLILVDFDESLCCRYSRKSGQLNEVLAAASLDPGIVSNLTNKLDAVLDSKNAQIKQLTFQIAKVTKSHDDLVRVYNAKLTSMGVPVKDLNVQLLADETMSSPAGLVSK